MENLFNSLRQDDETLFLFMQQIKYLKTDVRDQKSGVSHGFTIIELILVLSLFGVILGLVALPLATLQTDSALRDATIAIKDTLRRAETQAMSGYLADSWGVHLSGAGGCIFPATQYYIFRGNTFDSASDTSDVFDLPVSSRISSVSIGGGCDVIFTRFHGSTTSTGIVTLQNNTGATNTVSINQYGRISE